MWRYLDRLADKVSTRSLAVSPAPGPEPVEANMPYELKPSSKRKHSQMTLIEYSSPENTRFEVFWQDYTSAEKCDPRIKNGVGPTLSLIVCGYEVLRLDCLGAAGHHHLAVARRVPGDENRLWFRETTALEQIERSIFELERNIHYYLLRNPVHAVRHAVIPADEHIKHCREARAAAIALWDLNIGGQ